jgi:hypothetical protein
MAQTVEFKEQPHPSPAEARRTLVSLLFALFGAPAAWSLQEIVGYALTAEACFPNDKPLPFPDAAVSWDKPAALALNILALVVCAAATWTAWSLFKASKDPAAESGLGPTRAQRICFMSLAGLMTGFGFLAATLFNLVDVAGVPQCSG